jgi:hypothetical protein
MANVFGMTKTIVTVVSSLSPEGTRDLRWSGSRRKRSTEGMSLLEGRCMCSPSVSRCPLFGLY